MYEFKSGLRYHVIEPGQTRKEVADLFGVSVSRLLKHNERALGNRWDAGIELSDPNNRERLTKKSN